MKHFLSLGAGVQSSTLALMAAHGEITPMPDGAIFADTMAEPRSVYKWLDWLEKQLPFPVHRVSAGYKKGQRMPKEPIITQWIGISVDEASRMKTSRDKWIHNRWPLIEMGLKRHDCKQWMKRNGYPEPPRSSCIYCPFHNNAEWRRLRDEEPKEFAKAARFEKALQKAKRNSKNHHSVPFLHKSCIPIDQVDLSTEEDNGQTNMFQNDCTGMCGV